MSSEGQGRSAEHKPVDTSGGPRRSWWEHGLRVLLPLIVVVAGVLGAARLIATAPQAPRRTPGQRATLVAVRSVELVSAPVVIEAPGRVVAAQEVELTSQVGGEIVAVHPAFELGGRIAAGDVIVRIDPATYRAALDHAEASVARKEAELRSADRELARIQGLKARDAANTKEIDDAETARAVAAADLAAAQATRAQAAIDLERTTIRAPYNGIITSAAVTIGTHVTTQTRLASFVGTDAYWVLISVPVDRLNWIVFPDGGGAAGSSVRITQQVGAGEATAWRGRVLRLLGDLEPQGRMARVLVEAPHPLDTTMAAGARRPLLIDAYVQVEVEGRTLDDVVALERSALRNGDQVWLMTAEGTLEIRPVEVAYRGREQVLIGSGLTPGEQVVVSDLPTPVAGMPLRVQDAATTMADGPETQP